MTLLIAGTNRPNSTTLKLTQHYAQQLQERGEETTIISLADLPADVAVSALYGNKHPIVEAMQQQLDAVRRVVIVAPEYNGSVPGILKLFIDALRYPDSFVGKTVALVGLSAGVQGNSSGLSHLNDTLSYLRANVLGLRLQLGQIMLHFDGTELTNPFFKDLLSMQLDILLSQS